MCNIDLAEINKKDIENCKPIKDKMDKNFVVMKLNYIDKIDYDTYSRRNKLKKNIKS